MARVKFDSGVYTHHLAPFAEVNGGAMEFVFDSPFSNPLYSFRGPARLAGEFHPFGSGPTRISLHPIGAPQGLPFVSGELYTQISAEENAQGGTGTPSEGV
jgi:hypothetical protein